jgi:hypothetical protein
LVRIPKAPNCSHQTRFRLHPFLVSLQFWYIFPKLRKGYELWTLTSHVKKGRDKKTWNRTLEEFLGAQRAKKFPAVYRTRRYTRSRRLASSPILSWTNRVGIIIKHHSFKINILLSLRLDLLSVVFLLSA